MNKLLKGGLVMIGLFAGCSQEATTAAQQPVEVAKGKVALVYFSWGGNTRFAAETPYNSDFHKCCDEAKPECYGKTLRPIKPIEGLDLSKYDLVFVGTPNWWGTMAPPVRTWATQSKDALKGKTVCLFQTHGGGGMERVGKAFAEVIGDTAKVLPPKAFAGSSIKSSVAALEAFVTERINVK